MNGRNTSRAGSKHLKIVYNEFALGMVGGKFFIILLALNRQGP